MKMSNDIHNKIADALASVGLKLSDGYTRAALLLKMKGSVSLNFAVDGKPVTVTLHMTESGDVTATTDYDDSTQPLQRQHKSRWKNQQKSRWKSQKKVIHEKAQGLSNNCAGTTCWHNYKYQNWRG